MGDSDTDLVESLVELALIIVGVCFILAGAAWF